MLPHSHRVPLETAHQFLATFGITKPTREYQRWVKEDGFDFADFPGVLGDSPYIFVIDWKAGLDEELIRIADTLVKLDLELIVDVDPDTMTGFVECEGRRQPVKFLSRDGDDFTSVIVALQRVVPPTLEFRASPNNGQCDQWVFAVLPRDEWAELSGLDAELVNSLYVPLARH
jgi:hypothetical protein